MATHHDIRPTMRTGGVGHALLVAACWLVGFYGSAFGFVAWLVGPVLLGIGLVGGRHARWGTVVAAVGLGLMLGTATYLLVGLALP